MAATNLEIKQGTTQTIEIPDVRDSNGVLIKPAIEAIGLDAKTQIDKLLGKSWATTVLTPVVAADARTRQMITADVRTFLMLLATIDERRVAEHVRPKLIAYQSEVAEAIEQYWTRGRAVNHRLIDPSEPITYTWDEVTAVMGQRYGVDISVPQLTRMLRAAGVLRAHLTEPRKAFRPMFWFCKTHWEVHPHAVPFLLRKVEDTAAELREFRFLQTRLELDGLGSDPPNHHHHLIVLLRVTSQQEHERPVSPVSPEGRGVSCCPGG